MRYQIAHKDALYGSGGYYDSVLRPDEIDSVDGAGDNAVRYLSEVFPGGSYARATPAILSADEAFLEKVTSLFKYINENFGYCAPSLALRFSHGITHDSVVYLSAANGLSVFYPTYRDNDRPFVRLLDLDQVDISTHKDINNNRRRRYFYLSSAGSFNYGHWLVDDLPRIRWLLLDPQPTTILLQSFPGMDEIRAQSLNFLLAGTSMKLVFLNSDEIARCSELTYVTPVSFHPYLKNVAALTYLRQAVRSKLPATQAMGKRLFVRRRSDRGRQILNQAEVEALVVRFGFSIIDPEDYGFAGQANIFAKAKFIVGTMCAAMCNTAFSEAGAQLLYLAPNDWVEPFYWDLASVMGHSYVAIHGERANANEAPHLDDFHIDLETLKSALEAMVATPSS